MVHTEDASQVVPAAASPGGRKKDSYIAAVKARQEELRNNHENKPARDLLPLEKARELRWKGAEGGYLPRSRPSWPGFHRQPAQLRKLRLLQ